jgi:hypothetical protein
MGPIGVQSGREAVLLEDGPQGRHDGRGTLAALQQARVEQVLGGVCRTSGTRASQRWVLPSRWSSSPKQGRGSRRRRWGAAGAWAATPPVAARS